MSIAPLHRDTDGRNPLIPPHLLKRILQKIEARKAKADKPAKVQPDAWAAIDRLEAAR